MLDNLHAFDRFLKTGKAHWISKGVARTMHVTLLTYSTISFCLVWQKGTCFVISLVTCDFRSCILCCSPSLTQTVEKLPLYLDSFWSRAVSTASQREQAPQLTSHYLLIGCGGGFQQECGQPYSPVAEWMRAADVALEDEGQLYRNMEEAASIARTPRKCLEIWCGDHSKP